MTGPISHQPANPQASGGCEWGGDTGHIVGQTALCHQLLPGLRDSLHFTPWCQAPDPMGGRWDLTGKLSPRGSLIFVRHVCTGCAQRGVAMHKNYALKMCMRKHASAGLPWAREGANLLDWVSKGNRGILEMYFHRSYTKTSSHRGAEITP